MVLGSLVKLGLNIIPNQGNDILNTTENLSASLRDVNSYQVPKVRQIAWSLRSKRVSIIIN